MAVRDGQCTEGGGGSSQRSSAKDSSGVIFHHSHKDKHNKKDTKQQNHTGKGKHANEQMHIHGCYLIGHEFFDGRQCCNAGLGCAGEGCACMTVLQPPPARRLLCVNARSRDSHRLWCSDSLRSSCGRCTELCPLSAIAPGERRDEFMDPTARHIDRVFADVMEIQMDMVWALGGTCASQPLGALLMVLPHTE